MMQKLIMGRRGRLVTVAVAAAGLLGRVAHETMLFAAIGFAVGGLSDFITDLIWLARSIWRAAVIHRRYPRADALSLTAAERPGRIAIFVPAWDESAVIGPMLRHAIATLGHGDWRLYVGAYPNDPQTIAAIEAIESPRIRIAICDRDGPTTKADCLNTLWRAMNDDEARDDIAIKAVVLHDAEDVMHASEITVYDRLIERFDLVQLPVLPLPNPRSRWISGHYMDEFAESHGKTIVVREAIGAGVPSAGVGCAIRRSVLGRIAAARGGSPFDEDSLTEDYELGLRIAELGGSTVFVRLPESRGQGLVAVRAHFPATLDTAIRQKARWIAGIALSGWDRLGWRGGPAEYWMRLHDRRAPLAAIVLLAAYLAMVLIIIDWVLRVAFTLPPSPPVPPVLAMFLNLCFGLLVWRLAMRCWMVTRVYGPTEGLIAIPRAIVSNIIAVMAAWRAIRLYLRMRRDGVVTWDKTAHYFPVELGSS